MSAQGLPAHILSLFGPRPPAEPLPSSCLSLSKYRKGWEQSGVSEYLDLFELKEEANQNLRAKEKKGPYESPRERKVRVMKERFADHGKKLEELRRMYDPKNDSNAGSSNPLNSIFVARISYDTSERKLKKELEVYGPIKKLKMVYCKNSGRPKGYAFVEYHEERDAKAAYKNGDGRKIDGRRIMIDVERGRTQSGWLPRRLGGGRGSARKVRGEKGLKIMEMIKGGNGSSENLKRRAEGGEKNLRDRERESRREKEKQAEKEKMKEERERERRERNDPGMHSEKSLRKEKPPREERERPAPPREERERPGPPREERERPPREERERPPREEKERPGPLREERERPGPPKEERERPAPPREERERPGPPREERERPGPPREDRERPPREERERPPREERERPPREERDRMKAREDQGEERVERKRNRAEEPEERDRKRRRDRE